MASEVFTLTNPVFSSFAKYAALVLLKTMLMSGVTAYHRMTKKAFANEEDAVNMKTGKKYAPVVHPAVERVRRCHLNDLENVLPFVLVGLLYVSTTPPLGTALLVFRTFAASRFIHTVVYLGQVPQPARALSFLVGLLTTIYMVVAVLQSSSF